MLSVRLRHAVLWIGSLVGSVVFAQGQPASVWQLRSDPAFATAAEYPFQELEPRSSMLTSAPDGDVYFHALNQLGQPTVSRLRAGDQSVVWRRAARAAERVQDGRTLYVKSTADGGTLIMAGVLSRFDADGRLLWSRALNALLGQQEPIIEYANGDLVIIDHYGSSSRRARILRLDGLTGAVRGALDLPLLASSCRYQLMAPSHDGGVYLSNCSSTLSKLDADFSTAWRSIRALASYGPLSSVADTTGIYLSERLPQDGRQAVKLAVADGAVEWQGAPGWDRVRFDADGDLIGQIEDKSSTQLVSIEAATGSVAWSSVQLATRLAVEPHADRVFVAGTLSDGSGGYAAKLDGASGVAVWSTTLHGGSPGQALLPRALHRTAQGVWVSGADCAGASMCRIGLVRLDEKTGLQRSVTFPEVAQSPVLTARSAGGDALIMASVEGGATGQRVQSMRVETDGSISWNRTLALHSPNSGVDAARVIAAPDGGVIVGVNSPSLTYPYLAKYAADGALVWSRLMTEGEFSRAAFSLDVNTQGHIFASVARITWLGVAHTFIERFDAGTGSKLWSLPVSGNLSGAVPNFALIGDDFVVPLSAQTDGFARFSGVAGMPRWNNAAIRGRNVFVPVADGDRGYVATTQGELAAFSLSDGQILWWYRFPVSQGESLRLASVEIGPEGDVYAAGARVIGTAETGIAWRLNGQSGTPIWINRFDSPVGAPSASAMLRYLNGGELWLTQSTQFHTFLTRLETGTGNMLDATLLNTSPTLGEGAAGVDVRYGERSGDGGLLAYGIAYEADGSQRPWTARLVAPAAAQRGDLALSLASTAQSVDTGLLVAEVTYTGAEAIADARIHVQLSELTSQNIPEHAVIAEQVTCIVNGGGNCAAQTSPTGIRASLNLQPGASVQLSAKVKVFDVGARVVAEVYAPYGLFEADLMNNRQARPLGDRLFVDGFDAN